MRMISLAALVTFHHKAHIVGYQEMSSESETNQLTNGVQTRGRVTE